MTATSGPIGRRSSPSTAGWNRRPSSRRRTGLKSGTARVTPTGTPSTSASSTRARIEQRDQCADLQAPLLTRDRHEAPVAEERGVDQLAHELHVVVAVVAVDRAHAYGQVLDPLGAHRRRGTRRSGFRHVLIRKHTWNPADSSSRGYHGGVYTMSTAGRRPNPAVTIPISWAAVMLNGPRRRSQPRLARERGGGGEERGRGVGVVGALEEPEVADRARRGAPRVAATRAPSRGRGRAASRLTRNARPRRPHGTGCGAGRGNPRAPRRGAGPTPNPPGGCRGRGG